MNEFLASAFMVVLIVVFVAFLVAAFVTVTDKGISFATKVVKFDDGKFAVRMYVICPSCYGWQFLYKSPNGCYGDRFGCGALYDNRKFNTEKEAANLLLEFEEWHKKVNDKGRAV